MTGRCWQRSREGGGLWEKWKTSDRFPLSHRLDDYESMNRPDRSLVINTGQFDVLLTVYKHRDLVIGAACRRRAGLVMAE